MSKFRLIAHQIAQAIMSANILTGGVLVVSISMFFSLGCEQDEIRSYVVRKDRSRVEPAPVSRSRGEETRPGIHWVVPEGWRELPVGRPMRIATFEATNGRDSVEVAVSAFPGSAGGMLANVNRWRNQLNLEQIDEDVLSKILVPFTDESVHGFTLDMVGVVDESPSRIIGAIIDAGEDRTLFIKAMGQPSVISAHKDTIVQFARSFRLSGEPSHESEREQKRVQIQTVINDATTHNIPGHWRRDSNPSPISLAVFHVENAAGPARFTITVLPGDGGGRLPNINRWRQQLDLPPVDRIENQPLIRFADDAGLNGLLIDLLAPDVSSNGRQRILVAMLSARNATWFFKMTGTDAAIEKEKQNFELLVRSNAWHSLTNP